MVTPIIPPIKRFQHPSYTETEWQTLDPYLKKGEIGFVINDLQVIQYFKTGPGYWNALDPCNMSLYPYDDLVTNEIGDIKIDTSQKNRTVVNMLKDMISPFAAPAITGLQNNASGGYAINGVIEIGNTLSGSVTIIFTVTNQDNLAAGDNLYIEAGGIFNEEGWMAFSGGQEILTLINPLLPGSSIIYTIRVKVKHDQGESNYVNTTIAFKPNIIWGNSTEETLTGNEFANIGNKHNIITTDYTRDYPFSSINYHYLGIPVMLNPANVVFTDVTNPDMPAGIDVTDLGVVSVNNGVGTYNYRLYRSTYLLINPITLRVA